MTGLTPLEVPIDIAAEEARRRAAEELAKAKYGGTPDWLEDSVRRFVDFLDWLVEQFGGLTPIRSGGGVSWGFVAVVFVLLVLIALVVWRVGLPRWRQRTAAEKLDLDPVREAADYRTSAEEFAAAGDWRAAVRDRYRAVVRDLEVRTIIEPRPGRTAWEVATVAGRLLPTAQPDLYAGADLFGDVAYGDRPAEAGTYATMAAIDGRIVAAADATDVAAAEDGPAPRVGATR